MNILTNVLLGRNSRITNAIGYIDTGNSLRCSLTGRHVAIATYSVAAAIVSTDLIPLIDEYIRNPASICSSNMENIPAGIHLVPYNTICSRDQMMLAVDADYMFIDNKYMERNPLIGISPCGFTILHTDKCILLGKYYMKRGKRHVKHNTR